MTLQLIIYFTEEKCFNLTIGAAASTATGMSLFCHILLTNITVTTLLDTLEWKCVNYPDIIFTKHYVSGQSS